MNELHLFAGAGGGILGGILLGHTCVCAVEIEPYCRQVLLQRQRDGILPKFPIWDDVRTFDGNPWRGRVDVVCGGFPCQDISAASSIWNKHRGISGPRSSLWGEMARIASEIQPRFIFIENSPLLRTRGLNVVLKDVAEMGYDARWGVVSAAEFGAPHKRERMWILCSDPLQVRREWGRQEQHFIPRVWRKGLFEKLHEHQASMAIPSGVYSRMVDGVAHRVDRLKAIGNGQVPVVASLAFKTLTQHEAKDS